MNTTQVLRLLCSVVLTGLGSFAGGRPAGVHEEVSFIARRVFRIEGFPVSIIVGDFNADGRPDLATANLGANSVSILLGNGDGTFQEAGLFGVGVFPASIAVGDFNADGRQDLATANSKSSSVSILINNSATVVNDLVSFVPLPATFQTLLDTTDCPAGFAGTFRFSGRLTNHPTSPPLTSLVVEVNTLTNGNLLQNAEGGPGGVGALLPVPAGGVC